MRKDGQEQHSNSDEGGLMILTMKDYLHQNITEEDTDEETTDEETADDRTEQQSQSLDDQPICRICLCTDLSEDGSIDSSSSSSSGDERGGGELIAPCKCSGTNKYVHRSCLEKWVRTTRLAKARRVCQQCHTPYALMPRDSPRLRSRSRDSERVRRRVRYAMFAWWACAILSWIRDARSVMFFLVQGIGVGTSSIIYYSTCDDTDAGNTALAWNNTKNITEVVLCSSFDGDPLLRFYCYGSSVVMTIAFVTMIMRTICIGCCTFMHQLVAQPMLKTFLAVVAMFTCTFFLPWMLSQAVILYFISTVIFCVCMTSVNPANNHCGGPSEYPGAPPLSRRLVQFGNFVAPTDGNNNDENV